MNENLRRDLTSALNRLPGLLCWEVIAGKGTGSNFTADFGRKVPWARPLTNPTLSEEARRYTREYSLYVECPWRLEADRKIVSSWAEARDDADSEQSNLDHMLSFLARLKGTHVTRVEQHGPALDLRITFDNGLILTVFCDETEATGYPCYGFFDLERSYSVLANGVIECEPRTPGL